MSSDGSQLPDSAVQPAAETPAAPPSDELFAARLRGFGPIGILGILLILLTGNVVVGKKMVVLPIGAVFVLLWTWRSRTPWREIGYSRPRSWIGTVYAFERLGKLLGSSVAAKTAIVLLTSALFGLDHYRVQGLAGAEQAAIAGLVYGTISAVTGRIWIIMCGHATFDLTALAMIYWNLEDRIAHLVLK